jgi:drug/metabolite transporter (DMT)-like permease
MINILILLAIIFWGLSFIATKISLEYLGPVEIIAVRMLLGIPVLFAVIKFKKLKIRINREDALLLISASLILGLHFYIQAAGLIFTTATNTAWLITTIPAFIAAMSYFFLKEKLTRKMILGIIIATAGVLILVSDGNLLNLDWLRSLGDWIILASCITWSIYTIITRNISRKYNPLVISFLLLILPACLLLLLSILSFPLSHLMNIPLRIAALLVFLGVFCLGLAHWFWLEGLSKKGASRLGVFLYLEPLVTTIAAIPLLNERFTVFLALGAVFIVLGVYLVQINQK